MAAAAGGTESTSSSGEKASSKVDGTFDAFIKEVKEIEKRDAVLTSTQQIDRLLRPASKYGNLNPFEVLMIDFDTPEAQRRKAYRKLSFLVHPDKNLENRDRAQIAFEAVNKAHKMFDDEEQMQYCNGVVEEAKETLQVKLEEKRKLAKKEGKETIEEDDPVKYKQAYRNAVTKLFADLELKKKKMEKMESNERKRERDDQDAVELKTKKDKEWKTDWEASQIKRVDSWRDFQKGGKKKKAKTKGGLKPPKLKQEKRS